MFQMNPNPEQVVLVDNFISFLWMAKKQLYILSQGPKPVLKEFDLTIIMLVQIT